MLVRVQWCVTFHIIYKTTCTETGRYYIGLHTTEHLDDGYLGSGLRLRRSVRKYGREKHVREVLAMCASQEELHGLEASLVDASRLADSLCMNLKLGGIGGDTRSGRTHTLATKLKISESLRGHATSEDTRAKIGASSKGRMLGKPLSDDHKRKLSDAHQGKPSPLRGVPRSPEVVAKMSAAAKQYAADHPRPKKPPASPVPKNQVSSKLSAAARRQWADPEMRERMLAARRTGRASRG